MDIHDLFHQPKGQLALKVEADLMDALKKIPSYATLKGDIHFIVMAMNFIEYLCKGLKSKPDKKAVVVKTMTTLFNLSNPEQLLLDANIQALFDLGCVKVPTMYKIFKTFMYSFFKKR